MGSHDGNTKQSAAPSLKYALETKQDGKKNLLRRLRPSKGGRGMSTREIYQGQGHDPECCRIPTYARTNRGGVTCKNDVQHSGTIDCLTVPKALPRSTDLSKQQAAFPGLADAEDMDAYAKATKHGLLY
jgi:hypothetical protein